MSTAALVMAAWMIYICIGGHYVDKNPSIGEELACVHETGNASDPYASCDMIVRVNNVFGRTIQNPPKCQIRVPAKFFGYTVCYMYMYMYTIALVDTHLCPNPFPAY